MHKAGRDTPRPPVLNNGCGVTETPNFQRSFNAGQLAYFAVYLRDQLPGQQLELTIYQPDGSTWRSWEFSVDDPPHYSSSYWYWTWTLPADPQPGSWRWNVRFQGRESESGFTVGEFVFDDSFEGGG